MGEKSVSIYDLGASEAKTLKTALLEEGKKEVARLVLGGDSDTEPRELLRENRLDAYLELPRQNTRRPLEGRQI